MPAGAGLGTAHLIRGKSLITAAGVSGVLMFKLVLRHTDYSHLLGQHTLRLFVHPSMDGSRGRGFSHGPSERGRGNGNFRGRGRGRGRGGRGGNSNTQSTQAVYGGSQVGNSRGRGRGRGSGQANGSKPSLTHCQSWRLCAINYELKLLSHSHRVATCEWTTRTCASV